MITSLSDYLSMNHSFTLDSSSILSDILVNVSYVIFSKNNVVPLFTEK